MFRLFRALLLITMLGVTAALVAGFFGFVHPAFDTLANFRLHGAVALLAMAFVWSFRCSKAPSIVFALIGFGAAATCVSGLPNPYAGERPITGDTVLRLLHFNLRFDNPKPETALALIRSTNADILSLHEFSSLWAQRLDMFKADYPHSFHCGEWRNLGGTVIFSKLPLAEENRYCHDYAAMALVDVETGGKRFTLGAAHLRWPWPASGPRQVTALTPRLEQIGADALIAGDFNSVTWSHQMARVAEITSSTIFGGIGGTWLYKRLPASWARYVGLPIDNAMAKGSVRIVSARTLEAAGSDHLPVLIDFIVRDTECCATK